MEVLLRSSFPILSDRLRKLSKKRINGADSSYYDDDMYSPVTKTAREEEKLSELELDVLKAQNKNISSDNRILKTERVTAVNFILLYVSSDSQNLLDQYIKQNSDLWYFQDDSRKFTSALDLLSFGTAASLLNLLKWSHQVSSHGIQALADVVLIQSLFKMKQMENESPNSYGQRVITKSKQLSSEYKSICSDKILTALIYTGLLPHYAEPKAYL